MLSIRRYYPFMSFSAWTGDAQWKAVDKVDQLLVSKTLTVVSQDFTGRTMPAPCCAEAEPETQV
jgi:hypothetical protein